LFSNTLAICWQGDLWYLTGDNFYDRYGLFSVSIFAQLNKEAQGIPLLASCHEKMFPWKKKGGPGGQVKNDVPSGYDIASLPWKDPPFLIGKPSISRPSIPWLC
jgi:hypothetical protein